MKEHANNKTQDSPNSSYKKYMLIGAESLPSNTEAKRLSESILTGSFFRLNRVFLEQKYAIKHKCGYHVEVRKMLLYGSLKVHSLVFKQQWLGKNSDIVRTGDVVFR